MGLALVKRQLQKKIAEVEDEIARLNNGLTAAPLEPDLPTKRRFNTFQNYSEEYPLQMRTQMFDYQELLHRHSQTKNSGDVQAEIREDFAAVLISTLRVELKRVGEDGNSLYYQTPMHWRSRISSRTLGQ